MAEKSLDTSSFVPKVPMSALREKTHLQKRLLKYDQEEAKKLRQIRESQESLRKVLGGSETGQPNSNLLEKQKALMELRRARFSAPALGNTTPRRKEMEMFRHLSEPSVEEDVEVRFQELSPLAPRLNLPSATSEKLRRLSSSGRLLTPVSPNELTRSEKKKDYLSEEKNTRAKRESFKRERISLKPPPLQLTSSGQQSLQNDEGFGKSFSPTNNAAIVDREHNSEQTSERAGDRGEERSRIRPSKALARPRTTETVCQPQPVGTLKETEENKDVSAGVGEEQKKRRRKIGIQHCVNEIAPAVNGSVVLNEKSSAQFSEELRETELMISPVGGELSATITQDSNGGSEASTSDAMQMRHAKSVSQISKSNVAKVRTSESEWSPNALHLGVDPADSRRYGNTRADANTPHLTRRLSLNKRPLSRCSSELSLVIQKDLKPLREADDSLKNSGATAVAIQNFRRLAFMTFATNSFQSGVQSKKNSAPAKTQPERKLSKARLEELQKPTESYLRQLSSKRRSVSVTGAHPRLQEKHSAPELSITTSSGLQNFRKLSTAVVATNALLERRRRSSSVNNPTPTSPHVNEDKSLAEMMDELKSCRYLRKSERSSSIDSDE